jgi:hypothetical protein
MTKGIPKKRQRAEQLRKKRLQDAPALAHGAVMPLRSIPVPSTAKRASAGLAKAMHEPLSSAHYPIKRSPIGKRQVPGGADP